MSSRQLDGYSTGFAQDSTTARHIRLLAWAKATASIPGDQPIIIPDEFNRTEEERTEAMYALEIEIMRGMQAEAYPLTKAGQGRDLIDQRLVNLGIVVYGIAGLIALFAVLYWAGWVLP